MIDRRIAAIRQQITARPDLIQLIERHGLYASERKNTPLSEILDEMRSAISLTPAETSTGNGSETRTIAFELAFEYRRPDQTQAVAQGLMDRGLQTDARGISEEEAKDGTIPAQQTTG